MRSSGIDRRGVLLGGAAIGTAVLSPSGLLAQTADAGAPATDASAGPGNGLPARGEFVIRRAHVLTMDDAAGDLPAGDVHVRDGAIVAVGDNVDAPNAETIEGAGMICMPGFVETHWHLWTTCCRPILREDDKERFYFPVTAALGKLYEPEDSYNAVRHGLAEALFSGITTVHNWAHNVRSPSHADAEIRAMAETGIRGRFAYGTPQGFANDKPMDSADLARVKAQWIDGNDMLALGIASRNVGDASNVLRGNISIDMARADWGAARALGATITMHTSGASPIGLLDEAGLLGPDVQLVHPLLTTPEQRATLKARGVNYSTAPLGEARRAAKVGEIQLAELLQDGVPVSMSIDHTATFTCDCFDCMRTLYALNQHRRADFALSPKRMVQLATIDGARALGFADKVGSLVAGKRADLILIRTGDPNMAGFGDPYDALVNLAQPGNIDTVVVDGRILRRSGSYTALDFPTVVARSKESAAALLKRANWT